MAINGLKALKKKMESRPKVSNNDDGPLFISLKDGESVKVRFLQELDSDAETYDERRGTMTIVEEHSNPAHFRRRAVCTAEDGACWACEQTSNPDNGRRWRPKLRFYANVLVRNPDGEDRVQILNRGFSDRDIGPGIVEVVEEFGQITDRDFKISRKGSGLSDTTWTILPLAPKPLTDEEKELEVFDVSKFIKTPAYADQAAFYEGAVDGEVAASQWLDKD